MLQKQGHKALSKSEESHVHQQQKNISIIPTFMIHKR